MGLDPYTHRLLRTYVVGTDEDAIIDLLTKRSNAQRQEIRVNYQQMHGRVSVCVCVEGEWVEGEWVEGEGGWVVGRERTQRI